MIAEAVCTTAPTVSLNDDVPMNGNLPPTYDDLTIIDGLLRLHNHRLPEESGASLTLIRFKIPKGLHLRIVFLTERQPDAKKNCQITREESTTDNKPVSRH